LPWDHAAGCLFLNEAGGKCARQDGSSYRVDGNRKGMIAAATAELWDDFVTLLESSGYAPGGQEP
jgi:fructose-1,6-bisphosphatase/inositol monophosphatase family enzyme